MKRRPVSPCLALILGLWMSGLSVDAQNGRLDLESESVKPFQIFDDVYYIGTGWVSCYAVDTGDGLVLIDALYGGFPQLALKHLEELGLGDTEIKYVLATHGHWDHAGGAAFFQKEVGAIIGMTEKDWVLAEADASRGSMAHFFTGGVPKRDLVLKDGDTVRLGDTVFRCYVTPGHTEGVLSLDFSVRDGEQTHRAFVFGGVGLNFSGSERTLSYIKSVERIRSLASEVPPISVSLSNHPGMGEILQKARRLKDRAPGAPHPFVSHESFVADLKGYFDAAREKLQEEFLKP